MHQLIHSRLNGYLYLGACAAALVAGFLAGLAAIPDGLLQEDRIALRTMATYFFNKESVDRRHLGGGWSAPGPEGTWSRGSQSVLLVGLAEDRGKDLELEFIIEPFFAGDHTKQTVRVSVNGQPVGRWKLKAPMRRSLRGIQVNRPTWNSRHPKEIVLEYSRPRSPAELGVPGGEDRIAIRLSSLVIREKR